MLYKIRMKNELILDYKINHVKYEDPNKNIKIH